MIRYIKSTKQGNKYRVNHINGVWYLVYDLFQIQKAKRILDFLFGDDNCYLMIEFANEGSKREFTKNHEAIFDRNEKVCVSLSVNALQNVVLELMNSTWNSNEKKICSIFLVDMTCDIYAIKESIEKNKDIHRYVEKGINSFFIDVDDPFRVVCTFDFDKHSSIISKNYLGQHFIYLPFELN